MFVAMNVKGDYVKFNTDDKQAAIIEFNTRWSEEEQAAEEWGLYDTESDDDAPIAGIGTF